MKTILFGCNPEYSQFFGYGDTVRLARHYNSHEDVIPLTTDDNCPVEGALHVDVEQIPCGLEFVKRNYFHHLRWAATSVYCKEHNITGPIYCPDWDVLTFGNSEELTRPFHSFPVSRSKIPETGWSSVYILGDVEHLHDYCQYMQDIGPDRWIIPGDLFSLDMYTWDCWVKERGCESGNVSDVANAGVWDHNIHCGTGEYEMEPSPQYAGSKTTKRITWIGRVPFFTRTSGELVRANAIHCWGTYKARTTELVGHAI